MSKLIRKLIPFELYHFGLSLLGSIVYRFPSRKLKVIGITGTNGKTTTSELVTAILEEAGYKVGRISSTTFQIGRKKWPNKLRMTMPGRLQLKRFLRRAAEAGCDYAVLEVTSEGVKQHRHQFIKFEVAALTNLTREHIEAHGSFEKYRRAKGELFQAVKKIHILNLDDENAEYFLRFSADEKWGYTLSSKFKVQSSKLQSKVQSLKVVGAEDCEVSSEGIGFMVGGVKFNLWLLAEFNIYNALCAIAIARSQGIGLKVCSRALKRIKRIAGRMEPVVEEPFRVFVDYAFTPNALRKVYQFLKQQCLRPDLKQLMCLRPDLKQLICVLGASGGGRDEWKRPVLGKIACEFCDHVILTDEDSYDEEPMQIINQIAKGCSRAEKITDRRAAIRRALELARAGDVVVITGKGSEPSMHMPGGAQIPWDDREVAREEFNKLKSV